MRDRVSTKPLDKVAGLVYLLRTHFIPIYDAGQLEEDAWEVLINVMSSGLRAELLFYYPQRGNRNKSWCPSWQQVMTHKIIGPDLPWWPWEDRRPGDTDGGLL